MGADQAIVVTGASSGIGRAATAEAVKRGAHVFASVRRGHDADALKTAFGAQVTPLIFDVTDEAAIAAAAAETAAMRKGRRLLGLVNNAGGAVPGPLLHMTTQELRSQFEVNLFGLHAVTRAFAPLLGTEGPNTLAEGAPGRIVMISSVGGKRASPFIAAYAASKFALEGYAEGLRRELIPFGVDVLVVGPGSVKTAIWGKGLTIDLARYAGTAYAAPLARFTEYVKKTEAGGLPPERLGLLIWSLLTEPNPKTRTAIVPNAMEAFITRIMSPRMLDRTMARVLGLSGKG